MILSVSYFLDILSISHSHLFFSTWILWTSSLKYRRKFCTNSHTRRMEDFPSMVAKIFSSIHTTTIFGLKPVYECFKIKLPFEIKWLLFKAINFSKKIGFVGRILILNLFYPREGNILRVWPILWTPFFGYKLTTYLVNTIESWRPISWTRIGTSQSVHVLGRELKCTFL